MNTKKGVNFEALKELSIDMIYVENDGNETTEDFFISKYPVTEELYESVMGDNPNPTGKKHPVSMVSYKDALAFISKLNDLSHQDFRLPSDSEWIYAACGGKQSKGYLYSGSNNIDEVAWYDANSDGETHPVGKKKPNELGIYDMSGNIREWVDEYHAHLHSFELYGGCYSDSEGWCESKESCMNHDGGSDEAYEEYGFRLAMYDHRQIKRSITLPVLYCENTPKQEETKPVEGINDIATILKPYGNVLVISINGTYKPDANEQEVYEVVRSAWRASLERVKKMNYVLAVAQGIVRGVFVPEKWTVRNIDNKVEFTKKDNLNEAEQKIYDEIKEAVLNKSANFGFGKGQPLKYFEKGNNLEHMDSNDNVSYVDLGLSSGTKWKSQNEEEGFYAYEEAVENFGDQLPTKEQFEELIDECKWKWDNKKNGYLVTGPNKNSIFLPAAGINYCYEDEDESLEEVGEDGHYWTSEAYDSDVAWSLDFNSDYIDINDNDNCHGESIRLVQGQDEE